MFVSGKCRVLSGRVLCDVPIPVQRSPPGCECVNERAQVQQLSPTPIMSGEKRLG